MGKIDIPKSRFIISSLKDAIGALPHSGSKTALRKLKRLLLIAESLPDSYFQGLESIFNKNILIFEKMGYKNYDDLAKAPWVLKFFTWSAEKSKAEGQKLNLGGHMLELVVKNDKELHTALENFAKNRHKELLDTNFIPLEFDMNINPLSHFISDLKNFKVVKATDLTGKKAKAFLDFSYFLYNESTGKAIVIIEGQIKREGAVRNYVEQARNDSSRIFDDGFECVIDGKIIKVKPENVIIDELNGSKVLVRSSNEIFSIGKKSFTREINSASNYSVSETYHEFFTFDSTNGINRMMDDLFKMKADIGQLKKP